jgi:uncharacterized repeat protein (TIGR01451 family)
MTQRDKTTFFVLAAIIIIATLLTTFILTRPTLTSSNLKGFIRTYVQDQTNTNNVNYSYGYSKSHPIVAKPDDILKYVVKIDNPSHNQVMLATRLTDQLPSGLIVYSRKSSANSIDEAVGIIKPGHTVTKSYFIKITSSKNGNVLLNQVCFSATSQEKSNSLDSCDNIYTKISYASLSPLPDTGSSLAISEFTSLLSGVIAYIGYLIVIRKKTAQDK